jgi:hypothetical protein
MVDLTGLNPATTYKITVEAHTANNPLLIGHSTATTLGEFVL